METVYLDNAATTFPKPLEVLKAVNDCLRSFSVNPRRGNNRLVAKANEQMDLARTSVAGLLGARTEQLVFVPSATYGINLVMQGCNLKKGDTIYVSPFEHNAVVRCADHLKQSKGIEWRLLPIDKDVSLDVEGMCRAFEFNRPSLVVVTHASNVTGDLLPIRAIIEASHRYGAKVLVDAAQTVGCYTPLLPENQYDYLAFSSHKGLYGIPGAGGVVIREPAEELSPLVFGGTGSSSEDIDMPTNLPDRFEVGTAPLPAILSMLAGVEWIRSIGVGTIAKKQAHMRSLLVNGLHGICGVSVHGSTTAGNIGTVAFTSDFYSPQELSAILDHKGFCVRSGLHCAPLAHKTQGTFPLGVVRVSFSWFNEDEDVRSLLRELRVTLES